MTHERVAALEAEVERLRGEVKRVRALADAFADDGLVRHGGNVAWHIEDAIANEKGDFPDAADRRIASQRERAEVAEAKVARVEATIQREGKLHSTWDKRSEMVVPLDALRAALADAPAEQQATRCGAKHPDYPGGGERCTWEPDHVGNHWNSFVGEWPAEQRAEGGA
jgi:hypothetical protein